MPRFEVLIPAAPPDLPFNLTLRVEAESWLPALKVGLQKICGEQLAPNVLCDVKDDGSIVVTDPRSGRAFRIAEVRGPAPAPAPAARPPAPAPAAKAPAAAGKPAAPPAPAKPPPPRIGRSPQDVRREELLAELFLRAPAVQQQRARDEGLAFLLDLAMEKVGCESGSVFLAGDDGRLGFAVARGPKAAEVLRLGIRVPMGVGVVGFCAQEEVGLAVSDAEKDPRFHRAISEALRYPTRSLLCAPIGRAGRVYGALELVNKRQGAFDEGDLAVLSYLAHQAAEFLAAREAAQPL